VLAGGRIFALRRDREVCEIDPKTRAVVWALDRFDDFGNSVSNSQILDVEGPVRR